MRKQHLLSEVHHVCTKYNGDLSVKSHSGGLHQRKNYSFVSLNSGPGFSSKLSVKLTSNQSPLIFKITKKKVPFLRCSYKNEFFTNWPFLLTQLNFDTISTKPKQLWDLRIPGFSSQGGYLKALPWNNALNEVCYCNCICSPVEKKIWCHCNDTDNTLLPQKKACDKIKGFPCSIG